jgi:hypothetical protein
MLRSGSQAGSEHYLDGLRLLFRDLGGVCVLSQFLSDQGLSQMNYM